MVIEAIVRGDVLTRCTIPDEYLQDLEEHSWQRNVEFRQQVIDLQLGAFKKRLEQYFKTGIQAEYCLVFKSKMKDEPHEPGETDVAFRTQPADPDGGAAPGDQTSSAEKGSHDAR
jgi:hypothetical protein